MPTNYCLCGCNTEIPINRKFVHGHNSGVIGYSNKGMKLSEHKQNCKCCSCLSKRGEKTRSWLKGTKGLIKQSKETIAKRVAKNTGQRRAWIKKICLKCLKEFEVLKCHSFRKYCSKKCSYNDSKNVHKNHKEKVITFWENNHDKNVRRCNHLSNILKGRIKTEEHKRKAMVGMLKAVCKRPNKFEINALNYLNTIYSNKFKYTGNGIMIINHRSADAYSEELNTVVLFNGIYWHLERKGYKITDKNKRIVEQFESQPFLDAGYKVIFIWEDELNNLINNVQGGYNA